MNDSKHLIAIHNFFERRIMKVYNQMSDSEIGIENIGYDFVFNEFKKLKPSTDLTNFVIEHGINDFFSKYLTDLQKRFDTEKTCQCGLDMILNTPESKENLKKYIENKSLQNISECSKHSPLTEFLCYKEKG